MSEFNKELIGVDEANKVLDEMFAAEAAAQKPAASATDKPDPDPEAENTPGSEDEAAKAAADAAKAEADKSSEDQAKAKADDEAKAKADADAADKAKQDQGQQDQQPKGSRYAQARGRLEGGWKELNDGKAALQTERDTFKKQQEAERQALETERAEFEQQRTQAEQQFTPEAYEKAAARFEREGKVDLADAAREKAAELRKNPPAKTSDRLAAQRKEWSMKAGQEFPEIMKDNSPLQVSVAQILKAEPDLERHPKGIYLAARLASLQAQAGSTAAVQAKLDAQTKALSEAQAKIKQLEEEMSPGDGQNNNRLPKGKTFEQMSDSEKFADLERTALEMGTLIR